MRDKAFTLIELLVAVSLSVIILCAGSYMIVNFLRSYKSAASNLNKLQAEQIVLRNITKDCREAKKIETKGRSAVLTGKDGVLITYELINNKIRRREGNSSVYITDDKEVQTLNFSIEDQNLISIYMASQSTKAAIRNVK